MQVSTKQYECTLLAHTIALAGLLLITCATISWAGGPNYTVTSLGTLGPGASQANAVNSQALVVGYSSTNSGFDDGVSWMNGAMTDLGTLKGGQFSFAYSVNDSGQIVGASSDSGGNFHAILWQNGQMTDLGFLSGGSQAVAMAINNNGVVAGYAFDSSSAMHAVIWQPSGGAYTVQDLGLFSGVSSMANAINDSGAVVGTYTASDGASHAFLWQSGAQTDIGDLGGGQSYGEGVNSQGVVVGQAENTAGDWHAFSWQGGQMTDLGALDGVTSEAFGVNASGAVIGESGAPDGTDHAVLWQGGQMVDLGSFVGQNSLADAINASGQIVGQGTCNGAAVGFLLTPQAPPPPPANPPVTTATLSGKTRNNSGWYTGPVSATLTASDTGGPGVAATYYTLDGGAQTTYSAPFTITGDAAHTLTYWSLDTAGNAETPNSQTVKIDTTPPVTTAQLAGTMGNNGWYTSPVTLTLNAQDALSGVAKTMVTVRWCDPEVYSGPVTLNVSGRHSVRFWSVDVAGNAEIANRLPVKIDTIAPVLYGEGTAKSVGSGNWLVTIHGHARGSESGLAGPPTIIGVTDNQGSMSPSGVTTTMSHCDFEIQFTVNIPSTASGGANSNSGASRGLGARCASGGGNNPGLPDKFTVALSIQNGAGLTGTTTVHIGR